MEAPKRVIWLQPVAGAHGAKHGLEAFFGSKLKQQKVRWALWGGRPTFLKLELKKKRVAFFQI